MREVTLKIGDLLYNKETKVSFILVEHYQDRSPPQYFWKMLSLKSGALVRIRASELTKEILKQKAGWVIVES
jgi:hypothetical protein